MKLNKVLALVTFVVFAWSCKKDDDGGKAKTAPPRLLSEVAIEDDAEIIEYLETHFYNYEEFANPPADFDYKIKLDTIAGDNADKTSIKDFGTLKTQIVKLNSEDLGLDDGETNVEHKLYYLEVKKGEGENPTAVDSVYVNYEGTRLNGYVFDSALGAPIWLDLQGSLTKENPGSIKGFKNGMPNLKAGASVVENGDGTFEVLGYGVGVIFMPSGLAYFSGNQPGEFYAPLVFKINLLAVNTADHDRDGISSIEEDINKDGNLLNDDTDEDNIPNYLDTDDDGDGTLTREEIEDDNGNMIVMPPYPDTDNDGIPDYLDPDNK
ncbi:hypothetical protein [Maribacter sp.]|uniref:FKBP-type peptidyl-prolyl cis-trans isomerase n=1 Tax=Maribacter sp. TaxID=1897614 RepID=UPI0025B870DF|nr:hypothetical protein [Maribacter sp.]